MIDIKELQKYCDPLSVLYVEDEQELQKSVTKYLKKLFMRVETACDGEEGMEKYRSGSYDIVMTDIKMPRLSGIKMAEAIKEKNPDQELIIVSAHTETAYFMDAIHIGVSDYILKPIEYKQMNAVLYKVANRLHIYKENLRCHGELEKLVSEQTKSLRENYEQTLLAMVEMIEGRDSYTGGHSSRVAAYSKAIAEEMGFSQEECTLIYRAGMLHDIGKVTTPDTILLKPGKLSEREFALIKYHVTVSYQLLTQIPMYKNIADIVLCHHERYDGLGYPNGLKADEIPELSRIMIIADAFDAMTTNRIYKGRKSIEEAIEEVRSCSAKQFDPRFVPSACKVLSSVTIKEEISQLPKNTMENERFSYFFRDSLTDAYNKEYLDFFLQQGIEGSSYTARICFLKNFTQYNDRFGWDQGNILLRTFSKYLQTLYPDAMLFRVHGDDFVLMSEKKALLSSEEHLQPPFLADTEVSAVCHQLPVTDDVMVKLRELEQEAHR